MNISPPAELLTARQLAARWGLSEKTLERWRMLGTGPAFLKLGSRVLYPIDTIEAHERRPGLRATSLLRLQRRARPHRAAA